MSASRLGKNWADVDEEDEDEVDQSAAGKAKAARFETPVDADGIKTVIEYKERDGKTYKVTKRVRMTTVTKYSNTEMDARKSLEKFGKPKQRTEAEEASQIQQSLEEVPIEIARKAAVMTQADNAEDKFLEEALKNCENLFKEKKVWTDINRDKQVERDDAPAGAAKTDAAVPGAPAADAAAAGPKPGEPSKYVPPSLRGKGGDGKGKVGPDQEASLRITNLSEDVKEGDLQDLFGQFGRLQRVYLAKDMNTHLSKGFAFVTYYEKRDAQKAIDKLNGHGYDNLIIQVQWARPRA